MPKFDHFGGLAYLKRNPRLDNPRPAADVTPTVVAIAFNAESLKVYYSDEIAAHLQGKGTMLDFDLRGRTVCIAPTSTDKKNLPAVSPTNDKATFPFQSVTKRLSITGHAQGMTTLDATLTTVQGVPVVLFDLPSNLTVPEAPDVFDQHPFASMTEEAILAALRDAMQVAERHGLSDWEVEGGKLFAAVAVTQKRRLG